MDDYFGLEIPFARHCGITALSLDEGRTRLSLPLTEMSTNQFGVFHGGALLTLLDIAMGSAARVTIGAWVVAVDMQTAFIAPGRSDVIGEGRVIRAGRSLIFCEGEIRDKDGVLVAKGSGIYKAASHKSSAEPA
ncbi:MAG: PaaI family thioesterase [Methylovirgula sp.]